MKILRIKLERLRNESHLQYLQISFLALISNYPAIVNIVAALMGEFQRTVYLEATLVDAEKSSEYTKKLAKADKRRDKAVSGMSRVIKAALSYFDQAVADAAERLELRLKAFRTAIRNKPYEEESAAVRILLNDLVTTHASDVAALNIKGWVDELAAAEVEFDDLFRNRRDELASRPQENLRDVREKADTIYRNMITLIEAFGALNGYEILGEFITKLNVDIKYFNEHIPSQTKKDLDAATVDDIPDQIYEGEPLFPMPVVYYEGEKLLFTIDYEVSYHDNDSPGTAKIIIHGKGEYTGIKEVSFKITGMVNN
jgi:hypothetical protein